ncbi:MAG: helix-turn-helix domain-containing protein [Oscillospiraceae bacterium]|jgi:excisionase family DNA binding protein|nr:helix-turn-helix domain-containing protein [Oscillospiraceae bacterium]
MKEACERLGIGHWAVYQQIHQHNLKSVKIGKRRLISTRAIDEFIATQEKYGEGTLFKRKDGRWSAQTFKM